MDTVYCAGPAKAYGVEVCRESRRGAGKKRTLRARQQVRGAHTERRDGDEQHRGCGLHNEERSSEGPTALASNNVNR